MKYDFVIIGAGIVGLATGLKLLEENPSYKIAFIEKENGVAKHQTGHNSGVIHSGIYYTPGSLKAINCRNGYQQLIEFADKHDIPYDLCGKVIVATEEDEKPLLEEIYQTGLQNQMQGLKRITPEEIKEKEPHVRSVAGIWVPQTGIINYATVAEKYFEVISQKGGEAFFGEEVIDINQKNGCVTIVTKNREIESNIAINCAGLYADKVAKMTTKNLDIKMVPFRGEYYKLKKEKEYLVNNLIYPVPNPDFPFLGVHFTRMIKGGREAGPNAVLAFRREGYSRWDFNLSEFTEIMMFRGLRKVAQKYWKTELGELQRSFSKRAFVNALKRLMPEITMDDVERGGSGVRAQAIDRDGNLVDDFSIVTNDHVVNVLNAPSPAATASLAVGETIAQKALEI